MSDKKTSKFRQIKIIGTALFVLLIIEIIFGPISYLIDIVRIKNYQTELSEAKDRWEMSGITNYQVDLQVLGGLPCIIIESTLIVSEEEIRLENSDGLPLEYCPYQEFTVDEMFARIERDLNNIDIQKESIWIKFDPDYGFINQYETRYYGQRGWLGPIIGECCVKYIFTNFKPVSSPSP